MAILVRSRNMLDKKTGVRRGWFHIFLRLLQ